MSTITICDACHKPYSYEAGSMISVSVSSRSWFTGDRRKDKLDIHLGCWNKILKELGNADEH
jgi:hypothetical protein